MSEHGQKIMMKKISTESFSGLDFERFMQLKNHQPHAFLGLHTLDNKSQVIRLWRPGASEVFLEVKGSIVQATQIKHSPLFEYYPTENLGPLDYRVYHQSGLLAHDPYAFWPTFSELDQYLFARGVHYELHQKMGGRLCVENGVEGAKFSVWAPNARSVALVADFNYWNGQANPMRVLGYSGVWELFVPGLEEGEKYKFEIRSQQGELLVKSDPYAAFAELRPATASVLADLKNFAWEDENWLNQRKTKASKPYPLSVYEVHLGSWQKNHGHFLNYREIAERLGGYCQEMGFNAVELMPVQEHPLDESWGYQVSGFFAPTSRFGSVNDFKFFVNDMHRRGIAVILDWVPGHFPTDQFSIGRFDGSALYEHADPRQGFHPHWQTHIFNFGRREVSNFLIANALYWFEEMHIDGLRVDAVASMLYLDYGREEGQWIPNAYGGKENLHAIEFIKHLNAIVHERNEGILMIAEESTSFLGVTHSLHQGGLGFDLKWNMGWMNDTLRYFSKDSLFRHYHHHDLTFGLIYAFSEKFLLVLSHDEVVHGKKHLLSKMPGDMWQQFANLRLYISYLFAQPGKKLLFMGSEIGQWNEWNCQTEVDWCLLNFETHRGVQRMVKELNHLYHDFSALWEKDFHHETFQWIDFADTGNSVISYLRKSASQTLLCIHNFQPTYHGEYNVYCGSFERASEVFNSDNENYGGSGKLNRKVNPIFGLYGEVLGMRISLAPLATMIFLLE